MVWFVDISVRICRRTMKGLNIIFASFEHETENSKLSVDTEIWAHDVSFSVKSKALRHPAAPSYVKSNMKTL